MKSKIIILALSLIVSAIIYSCDTRTYDDISGGAITHPTYAKDIKPIMDVNCISCHDQNGSFPDLTNYSGVSDNAETILSEILSGDMPQGGTKLNTNTIKTFQNWMNNGKPQN